MKLKDFVTLGNLLSGYAAVIVLFVIPEPWLAFQWACYLIYIGYVFDVLDGPIARLLKQQTTFGGHFDTVCDYITNSISPGFIIFHFYWRIGEFHWLVAAAVGAFPVVLGTIRQAQQADRPLSYPCYWLGLPRPVLTIFVLALLNSSIFHTGIHSASPWREVVYGAGAALIIVLSFFHLSAVPFVNRTKRRWMMFLRFGMHMFLTMAPIVFLVGWLLLDWPGIIYDFLLFELLVYIFLSWTQIPKEDIRRIRHYVATGELKLPLVHVDKTWRPRTLNPFFLEDGERERTA
jgi:phosphatidylserine synthase